MNSFDDTRRVEARSLAILVPYLLEWSDGRLVLTSKGSLSRYLQETVGDLLMNQPSGHLHSVEFKAEQENKYGNFFLETWSNRNLEDKNSHAMRGSNVGWLAKLKADWLFYHFLGSDELFIMDLFKLQRWAFGANGAAGSIYKYPEKPQSKYPQPNDTWGRCVPIEIIEDQVHFKRVRPLLLLNERGAA